jgi:hypothetical protein
MALHKFNEWQINLKSTNPKGHPPRTVMPNLHGLFGCRIP